MRFGKREICKIQIKQGREIIYDCQGTDKIKLYVFAHKDEETCSQLLGLEVIDKATGEVVTQRFNLPVTEMYIVSIKEILAIEE